MRKKGKRERRQNTYRNWSVKWLNDIPGAPGNDMNSSEIDKLVVEMFSKILG